MEKDYSKIFLPSLKEARKRKNNKIEYYHFFIPPGLEQLGKNKTYYIKTYGCQGNIADSEKISGIMEALAYQEASDEEHCDVLFFNTCAVRNTAEQRVFGELGRLKGLKTKNPNLLIALCGCMPQEETTIATVKEKYKHVDLIFGTHNIYNLPNLLYEAYTSAKQVLEIMSIEGQIVEKIPIKRGHSQKAWIDIMYGCDEFCTYCIVPYTRGKERSRQAEDIIQEVKELVNLGYHEVTLLGQNVNAYGKDFSKSNYTFSNLLKDLSQTNISRIRFTTSHPRDLDYETMQVMASYHNIMPHLHLPVQSGSNKILAKMNRKYTKEDYLAKIAQLRSLIPDISLTTDIIVGFPGESEEDFYETIDLVKKAKFEGAFTFIFSPRDGTPAAKYLDSETNETKKSRLLELNKLINEGYAKGNARFENEIVEVLVEGVSEQKAHLLTGYTPHNKLVNFEGSNDLIGKLVKVKIEKAYTWHLKGKLIE